MGFLEDASIAVQEDYVDEIVLYKSLANIVSRNWSDLRGYIEQYRQKSGDQTLWIEFEKLHNSWKLGQKLGGPGLLPNILDP